MQRRTVRSRPSPDLAGLRDKYARLVVLRTVHDQAKRDPTVSEPDPRPEMAAIARAWPGALRELDDVPLDAMRERIAALEGAMAQPARIEPWMVAQDAFHRLARGALTAKRWVGKRKTLTREEREAFAAHMDAEARIWSDHLEQIASPPRGRLMDLVHARVAEELGVTERQARRLVFGPGRRPS